MYQHQGEELKKECVMMRGESSQEKKKSQIRRKRKERKADEK